MPNRGKFTIGFKVKVAKIIRETSSKFDGLNNKMDEVDVTGDNAKWLMCFHIELTVCIFDMEG